MQAAVRPTHLPPKVATRGASTMMCGDFAAPNVGAAAREESEVQMRRSGGHLKLPDGPRDCPAL
eukprot:4444536-Alexandrium_andersonii.AAC.1